jgi:hypothetical protein
VIYYRPDYTDPVGNIGAGNTLALHTGLETRSVIATIESDSISLPVGAPLTLELAIGAANGLASLTSYSVTLTATHLGLQQVDFLSRFLGPNAVTYPSADATLRVVRLPFTGNLTAGTYVLDVSATSPAGTDSDSVTIVVY